MNVTGFSDDDNTTQSVERYGRYHNSSEEPDFTTTEEAGRIVFYVAFALGIPGNILSAIVWLRHQVAIENSSAIYLAALAINDLVFLLSYGAHELRFRPSVWLRRILQYTFCATDILESLLVLSFSVVRLIAIRRPLQVRRIIHTY